MAKKQRFRLAKQQLCTCITPFDCTFLCRHCMTKMWKCQPNFMFCGWSEHKTTTFFFFPWTLIESFRIQLQRKLPTFDELMRQNKRDKVCRSALAYILVWDCASSISLLTASLSCCSSSTCSWHFFSSSLKEKNWQVKDRCGFDDSTSCSFRFIHHYSEIAPNLW